MKPNRWTGLDWWQRTTIVAFGVTAFAVSGALVLSTWLYNAASAGRMGTVSWISLSIFPLFMVLAVALLASAQRMVNMRMGHTHRTKPVSVSTARREEEDQGTAQVEFILDDAGEPAQTDMRFSSP